MNHQEKKEKARAILEKHGYSEQEINKILSLAFDKKKKKGRGR